jgi:hypothetical protein
MTGAGSLSPNPQTRHGNPVRTLTLGTLRDIPQKGVSATEALAWGRVAWIRLKRASSRTVFVEYDLSDRVGWHIEPTVRLRFYMAERAE